MLFSRKDLSKIILPLFIEQALAVTIGMLDTVMVSTAGEAAVSGVSLVDTVNLLLVYLFAALAGGGAVVISQFIGQREIKAAKESAKQLTWVVFFASSLLTIFAVSLRAPLLKLIFGKIEADVMENAKIYFLFTALSYPFLGLYNAGASIYRAQGNSKASMLVSLLMNGLNVGGNALLIFVFDMGAAGAAIATLFSRIVGAIIMIVMACKKNKQVFVEKLFRYKPDFKLIKRVCGIGIPNGLENGMFQLGKVITQSLISSLGTISIAANAAANSLTSLQYIPGNAIGLAMITVVGQCIGAGEKEQAKKYSRRLVGLTYLCIMGISSILCIFSKGLVGLFGLSQEATSLAQKIIYINSISVCTIWPIAFTLPTSFRAASDVKYPMVLSVISMWVFRVGLSFVFSKWLDMGVMGVWYAMYVDHLFRAVMFAIRYLKGKWLTKYKELKYN